MNDPNKVRQWEQKLHGISAHHIKRYLFAANRVNRGMQVLDAACGCGYGAWLMFCMNAYVDAIDISQEAIKFANMHYPGPRYFVGDLTGLPSSVLTHQLAVSFEILEHLDDPRPFLNALRCEFLIASVPNEECYPFVASSFANDEYPHQRHYTPEQFDALLSECGFTVGERWCQIDKDDCAVRPGTQGKFLVYVAHR